MRTSAGPLTRRGRLPPPAQGPRPPCGAQHPHQVALVVDRPVGVLGGVASVARQALELVGRGAGDEGVLGGTEPGGRQPDGADRDVGVVHEPVGGAHDAGHGGGGALVERDLPVGDPRARRERRQADGRDDLPGRQGGLVGAQDEAVDRDGPGPRRPPDLDAGVGGEQEGRGIRVRIGEREVAAQRPGAADAHVGDAGRHRRQRGPALAHQGRALDRAVGHAAPDHELVAVQLQAPELGDALDVDDVPVVGEAQLHHEQQLRPARVQHGVVAQALHQRAGLVQRGRGVDLEGREPHGPGVTRASSAARTSRAASSPSPTRTSTPRSAIPRPSAASATTGVSEAAAGPMWPSRMRRSFSSP